VDAVTDISGYTLDTIYEDGEFVLCRARDPAGASPLRSSVLVVMPRSEHPGPESRRMMEHEYSLQAELDSAWAVLPLALTHHQGRTILVREDPGGEPLARLLGTPMELGLFLRLAVGLTTALRELHARGVIHKDVKPATALADSETGRVWLTGFGIASRLRRQRQAPDPPEVLAGTLAYMAPEQTGRMNRSIDSRSDLYALGVTLYEMLIGHLPFTASDPMEWVHAHVARQPKPPNDIRLEVPRPVSAIVVKLLAKTPEERYQTAAGVEHDLRRCLAQWETEGRIGAFPPGEHDTPDRLLIPETLYGRAREIEILLAAFERIVQGGVPEMVLVSGYSGVGKSSVVNELHKVLVPPGGLFASGKFDQYKRDIPYATLAQAFQSLIRPLLGKREAELGRWRDAFREALGPNGQLIVDLVPEVKLIIGEQPPVPELPPQEAQRRFQLVFRRFLGVFARPEHPLALFLDDLQWLDAATLDLLEDLLTQPDVRHVLLIGAYRDNEVTSAHPLMRKLDAIRNAGAPVREIVLAPLTRKDLGRLIVDSLYCDRARAAPLAKLVHEKTAGNPFFVIQFLSALADEGLLTFDHTAARWRWDLTRILAKGYTDNVVDLMVAKLSRLPVHAQNALRQLACLGNRAESALLATVYGESTAELHGDLQEVLRTGLVLQSDHAYAFLHDRVQEAAYSLIPELSRAETHLRIGRLLAAHTPPERREERIFEILNQLNRGAALITAREEREQLAELNLLGGQRAKASIAYTSALTYLAAGAALLAEDAWARRHALAFALELHRAECEFLTGALAEADERLVALSDRAANRVERATVASLRVDLSMTLDQASRAIAISLDYLRQVGTDWSPHPTDEEVQREYDQVWSRLAGRSIEECIDLPLMRDPDSLAILDVLIKIAPTAIFTDHNLLALTVCRAVNLSLERGNCDGSCLAYVMLGMVAGARFGDYQAAYRFGQLGYDLIERHGLKRFQARAYINFAVCILPWTKHVRDGREVIRRAFEAANQIGDVVFATYACGSMTTNLLAAGDPLVEVQREVEHARAFAHKARFGLIGDIMSVQLGLVRTLRGLTPKFGSFDFEQFDELQMERHFTDNPNLALAECGYWIRKMQAHFLSGDCASALDASLRAQQLIWTAQGNFEVAEYHFYAALSRAAACDTAAASERPQHVHALAAHHQQLEVWAANCPENFENRAALVGAEIARIEGRVVDAMALYEQAIRSAEASGFVHNEALANELAARFYAARGFETISHAYLRNARYGYLRWGADGKVRQLDQLYPYLRTEEAAAAPTGTIGAPVEQLDLATVIKVSQTITGEMDLEILIDTIMRTAIEQAGAERGLLMLPRGDEHRIAAEATTSVDTVIVHLRDEPVAAAALPETVLHYVLRTQETVILDDAAARQNPFSTDPYIRQRRARSILCLPLTNQAKLIGVLYLENNLAPRVFAPARIAVLKLLASEAAISLENTRLYRDLAEREARIRRLVDANIVGIFIWELEGRILEANEAFLTMVGYDREDLVARRLRWTDLTPPEWLDRDERRWVPELKMSGSLQPFEKEYFRKDGSRVPVLIGLATFEETGNQGVAFVLDLTERKRAEEERERLRQAQADLAYMSRVATMGELAASLAHEIKQPMAAAVTNAAACDRWLERDEPDLAEARAAATRMVADTRRAGEIIDRMRSLYGRGAPRREPVDVNGVIGEMVALLRHEATRHALAIRTELAEGLPRVSADRVQLQQVLMNLVLNGIEAMRDAPGGELTVTSHRAEDGQLLIAVTDAGEGIPPERADRIFEAFFTTKPRGTGMGLSISRTIVEAHGGRLWQSANPAGRGTTFQLTLPGEGADNPVPFRRRPAIH
jgi:PAS domain S-box-containing protein